MQHAINEQINKWFNLTDDNLRAIRDSIGRELDLGLRDEEAATIKMLITYVRELSRGDEIGSYLALDLGGTHFRVLLVQLNGDGSEPKVVSVTHDIPTDLLATQNGQELFDYIALKLLDFVQKYKLKRRRISLGFTFSFPCKQYGLTQSFLVKWCKGFNVGGVVNTDVVKQLKDALKRQLAGKVQAYIDVVAVLNDTTGTLVACANKNRDCRIGLIVGTGYNACYMERLERCEKWPANYTSPKQVIINCEWGAMGDNKEKRELDMFRSEIDFEIDAKSINPLSQTYEKMVGGMYVGEMLRLALLKLYNNHMVFCNSAETSDIDETKSKSNTSSSSSSPSSSNTTASNKSQRCKVSRSNGSKTKTKPVSPVAYTQTPRSPIDSRPTPASAPNQKSASLRKSNRSKSSKSSKSTKRSITNVHTDADSKSLPASNVQEKLNTKNIFDGKHLSWLAHDEINNCYDKTIRMLNELGLGTTNESDLKIIVSLGAAIIRRAAHLVASGISALLERMQRPFTVIGYDGSMIKYHPYFLKLVIEKTAQLTSKEFKFEFVQSSDGSGIGAAVVAAALHKERRPLYIVKPGKLYEMHFLRTQMQSQMSVESTIGQAGPQLPGLERVGSASSRASNASTPNSPASTRPVSPATQ